MGIIIRTINRSYYVVFSVRLVKNTKKLIKLVDLKPRRISENWENCCLAFLDIDRDSRSNMVTKTNASS